MWLGLVDYVLMYRTCFFTGPFGSGKTLGAVALAFQLLALRPRLRLLSNIPVSSFSFDDLDAFVDVIVLLDEGRRYLDARRWSSREFNIDYLRHLRSFLIVSAAFDVDTRLRRLVVERIFPFLSGPVWFYRVRLYNEPSGRLAALLFPRAYFGLYPRRYIISQEDYFYDLVEAFFELLAYRPRAVSDEDRRRLEAILAATVAAVRER